MASGSSPLRYGSTPLRSPLRYGRGLLAKLPSAKALSWGVGVVSREGAAASKSSARVVSSHLASVRVRAWRLSSDPEAAVRIRPRRRMSWLHLYHMFRCAASLSGPRPQCCVYSPPFPCLTVVGGGGNRTGRGRDFALRVFRLYADRLTHRVSPTLKL